MHMGDKRVIAQADLHELFEYHDGCLYWRKAPNGRVPANSIAQSKDRTGYYRTGIAGRKYATHRLIFLWHHGHLPPTIDHINRNPCDNRIENLRGAGWTESRRNKGTYRNSSTGLKGVTRNAYSFLASIVHFGKRIHLGSYKTAEDAARAYDSKARELHGAFASTNYPSAQA